MVDAMIDRDGYRPNVAIVLINGKNPVFWGKRIRTCVAIPAGRHQARETPEQAMYRELQEETGLLPQHVILGRGRLAALQRPRIGEAGCAAPIMTEADLVPLRLCGPDCDISLRASGHRNSTRGAGTTTGCRSKP
jgi:putative (di)nucleoside polyphosphate hydrolase